MCSSCNFRITVRNATFKIVSHILPEASKSYIFQVAYYSTVGQGCGDNRSLLVIPILAALGLKVPGLLGKQYKFMVYC